VPRLMRSERSDACAGVRGTCAGGPCWTLLALLWLVSPVSAQQAPQQQVPAAEEPAPSSSATPSDEAQMTTLDDEARKRFELGRKFYEAGRFSEAAQDFAEAYRLSERPQLLYNVYVANRDAGRWPEAAVALRGYLEKVPDAPDRVTLEARLKSIEQQVAQQEERARTDEERKRQDAERAAVPPKKSIVPWVLMGTGGALLVGSAITGGLSLKTSGELDDACENDGKLCPAGKRSDINSLRALAVTTDVLWSVGAVTLVTGLVLKLTGVLDESRERPVTANVGVGQSGLSGTLTVRY